MLQFYFQIHFIATKGVVQMEMRVFSKDQIIV